MHSSFLKMVCL